jgi:uncharacterized protein (DUF1330 family)
VNARAEVALSHYSIVAVTPSNEDWIPDYLAAVGPLVAQHGGRYLARTASHEHVEGDDASPGLLVIIEWPGKEAADGFYRDPVYAPHLSARPAGSESHWYSVAGKDDFA